MTIKGDMEDRYSTLSEEIRKYGVLVYSWITTIHLGRLDTGLRRYDDFGTFYEFSRIEPNVSDLRILPLSSPFRKGGYRGIFIAFCKISPNPFLRHLQVVRKEGSCGS